MESCEAVSASTNSSSSCPNSMFECLGMLEATEPFIINSKLEAIDGVVIDDIVIDDIVMVGVVLLVDLGVKSTEDCLGAETVGVETVGAKTAGAETVGVKTVGAAFVGMEVVGPELALLFTID